MRYLLCSFCFLIYGSTLAQFNSQNPSTPGADVTLSKQTLEVSNDLFNGRVNVSIPLYTHNFEGMTFPIGLNYAAANGVKPDELPGWVGSGWNLSNGGGYVHRTVRGRPDEVRDFQTEVFVDYDALGGIVNKNKKTTLHSTDYSYLSNVNKLNVANWSTQSYANSISPSQINYTFPPTTVSGPNGTYYTKTLENHHPAYDLVPDEFTFSVGEISGKFYLNHLNQWVVSSNDGAQYTVSIVTGEQTVYDAIIPQTGFRVLLKVPRIIKYLTVTSPGGIRYYFGNTDVNATFNNQVFDYSHSSGVVEPLNFYGRRPPFPDIDGNVSPTYLQLTPHTWHLTKVENLRTGSIINLTYKQEGLEFYKTKQAWGAVNETASWNPIVYTNNYADFSNPNNVNSLFYLTAISKVLTRKWTLTGINFPDGVTVQFTSTPSTQLSTNEQANVSDNAGFYFYDDIYYPPGILNGYNTLLKLDKILISFSNTAKKEISFEYSLSPSQRLQLSKVKEKSPDGLVLNEHSFTYNNSVSLPVYGAGKQDHWGFYNNKDFFASVSSPYTYTKMTGYAAFREPDNNFSKAEILTKVKYPTGGSVEFEYEPHTYSKTRTLNGITVLSSASEAGGLRIKRVRYYTGFERQDLLANETIFDYSVPGNSLTSGVLAIPPENYLIPDGAPWYSFRAEGYSPIYYEGSHVTYSYASETKIGNGKIVYKYTNYDNGFNDQGPIESNNSSFYFGQTAYKHNAFKRGKLISKKVYDVSDNLKTESNYQYIHDFDETGHQEVRSLYLDEYPSPNNYVSVSERIYSDNLVSSQQIEYTPGGNILLQSGLVYDGFGNIKETTRIDSRGEVIKEKNKYCYEYSTGGTDAFSQGINNLKSLGITNAVIEKLTIRQGINGSNPKIIGGSLIVYGLSNTFPKQQFSLQLSAPLPLSSFTESTISGSSFVKDSRYSSTAEIDYTIYDVKGNLLESIDKKGVVKSNIRGYNNNYIVAELIGVNYLTAISQLNSSILNNPQNDQALRSHLNQLRSNSGIFVTSYTYNPLVGKTSETDINGRTKYFEYDAFNRLTVIKDHDLNVLKKLCYNYAGQAEDCISKGWVKVLNSTTNPYNVTVTNLLTLESITIPCYPSSTTQQLLQVPLGSFNVAIVPMYGGSTVKLSYSGTTQNGTSFTLNNLAVNSDLLLTLEVIPSSGPCSFTAASGWGTPYSSFNSSGTTVTFTVVLYYMTPPSTWYSPVTVGTVNGGCRPTSARYLTMSESGRTWTVAIQPTGEMTIRLLSGTPPGSSFQLNNGSYTL